MTPQCHMQPCTPQNGNNSKMELEQDAATPQTGSDIWPIC